MEFNQHEFYQEEMDSNLDKKNPKATYTIIAVLCSVMTYSLALKFGADTLIAKFSTTYGAGIFIAWFVLNLFITGFSQIGFHLLVFLGFPITASVAICALPMPLAIIMPLVSATSTYFYLRHRGLFEMYGNKLMLTFTMKLLLVLVCTFLLGYVIYYLCVA